MHSQKVELDDSRGLAIVRDLALEPYLGWQHTKMNPLIFNRIGFVALVGAFECGWLDPEGKFFTLAKYEAEPVRPNAAADADGSVAVDSRTADEFSTVFVASIATELNPTAAMGLRGRPPAVAQLSVSHVGSSSFTLRMELSCEGESFGSMLLSFVHVDFKVRRPAPLPASKKVHLEAALAKSTACNVTAGSIARLPLAQMFSSVAGGLTHEKAFALRHSDFDFNLHLNQSMYQSFAVDALKEAATRWTQLAETNPPTVEWVKAFLASLTKADDGTATAHDNALQKNTLSLDAHVTSLRMDYLKEIQMPPIGQAAAPSVVCHMSPLPTDAGAFLFCIRLDSDAPNDMRAAGVLRLPSAAA